MTEEAKTDPCGETSASITSVGGVIRPRADVAAATADQQRGCVADRKSLGL
jgi:hypothetical protein